MDAEQGKSHPLQVDGKNVCRVNVTRPLGTTTSSVPSPRAPSEILGKIVGMADRPSMRQCALAGSHLLPHARRALFAEVTIVIGAGQERGNIGRMLECYTTRPYAQYARTLMILSRYRGRPGVMVQTSIADRPDLQKVITLLSTCQQTLDAATTHPPTSQITSLQTCDIIGCALDFMRIICAFPHLRTLETNPRHMVDTEQHQIDTFHASQPFIPRLHDLEVQGTSGSHLIPSLFPPGAEVCLRSLAINNVRDMDPWSPLVRRAGANLETLYVSRPGSTFASGRFSCLFTENTLTSRADSPDRSFPKHVSEVGLNFSTIPGHNDAGMGHPYVAVVTIHPS